MKSILQYVISCHAFVEKQFDLIFVHLFIVQVDAFIFIYVVYMPMKVKFIHLLLNELTMKGSGTHITNIPIWIKMYFHK